MTKFFFFSPFPFCCGKKKKKNLFWVVCKKNFTTVFCGSCETVQKHQKKFLGQQNGVDGKGKGGGGRREGRGWVREGKGGGRIMEGEAGDGSGSGRDGSGRGRGHGVGVGKGGGMDRTGEGRERGQGWNNDRQVLDSLAHPARWTFTKVSNRGKLPLDSTHKLCMDSNMTSFIYFNSSHFYSAMCHQQG